MKHMKFIDCPDCGGHGFITQLNENGQTSVWCMKCQGTGSIAVPMTNGDRVRGMSDEKLAALLCGFVSGDCCDCIAYEMCDMCGREANGLVKWLQQPAEGGDG